jgi:hypothetical protein
LSEKRLSNRLLKEIVIIAALIVQERNDEIIAEAEKALDAPQILEVNCKIHERVTFIKSVASFD